MYRLLAFRKSVQMSMYRLLTGGVYYQLGGTSTYWQSGVFFDLEALYTKGPKGSPHPEGVI